LVGTGFIKLELSFQVHKRLLVNCVFSLTQTPLCALCNLWIDHWWSGDGSCLYVSTLYPGRQLFRQRVSLFPPVFVRKFLVITSVRLRSFLSKSSPFLLSPIVLPLSLYVLEMLRASYNKPHQLRVISYQKFLLSRKCLLSLLKINEFQ